MALHGLTYGTDAAPSRFTADALVFTRGNDINAQDAAGLLKRMAFRTPCQQAALWTLVFEGRYWRPARVRCGVTVAVRGTRNLRQRGWGHAHFSCSKPTLPMATAAAATTRALSASR